MFLSFSEFLNESYQTDYAFRSLMKSNNYYLSGVYTWIEKLEPCDVLFLLLYAYNVNCSTASASKFSGSLEQCELSIAFITDSDSDTGLFYLVIDSVIDVTTIQASFRGNHLSPPDSDELRVNGVKIEAWTFISIENDEEVEHKITSVPSGYGYDMTTLNNMLEGAIVNSLDDDVTIDFDVKIPTEIPPQLVKKIEDAIDDDVKKQIVFLVDKGELPKQVISKFIPDIDELFHKYRGRIHGKKFGI